MSELSWRFDVFRVTVLLCLFIKGVIEFLDYTPDAPLIDRYRQHWGAIKKNNESIFNLMNRTRRNKVC